jgi:branched-chain amino acid aminotransferase
LFLLIEASIHVGGSMSSAESYIQACSNGRLHDAREPSVSALNRGFLYGDAIYEVWRTYDGVIFAWEEHWRRLERSAAALTMTLPLSWSEALDQIRRTAAEFRRRSGSSSDLYIRLQITRGGGAIGLDPALADRSDYVLLVQQNPLYSREKFDAGLQLSVAKSLRRNPVESLNPAWKTGNYLNNLLCLREARLRGADEVVILNRAGEVTETAVSNIAFVKDGEVITPPISAGILVGITRGLLLEHVARMAGFLVSEKAVRPEDFEALSECFLLSTTKDLTPVAAIDEHRFQLGHSSVTAQLKAAFGDYVRDYIARHPELALW